MAKLVQNNGKNENLHKMAKITLRGGAECTKSLVRALLSISLCIAMVLLSAPLRGGGWQTSAATNINDAEVTLKDAHEAYCGDTIDLTDAFTLTCGGKTLVKGTDYTAEVLGFPGQGKCTSCQTEGVHAVIGVSGCGAYGGSREVHLRDDFPLLYAELSPGTQGPTLSCDCRGLVRGRPFVLFWHGYVGEGFTDLVIALVTVVGSGVLWSDSGSAVVVRVPTLPGTGDCVLKVTAPDVVGRKGWTATYDFTSQVARFCAHQPQWQVDANGVAYQEQSVSVGGSTQRIRIYDENGVLDGDTEFFAEYVDNAHGDHNFFITHVDPQTDVELQHFYNLVLKVAGSTLTQLSGKVKIRFEAIAGIDAADSFVSRVTESEDLGLTAKVITDPDGTVWIEVETDHFSPYTLTDKLSEEEKAALQNDPDQTPPPPPLPPNVKTGDAVTNITIAGLGMVLVLALGVMLKLITKKKFEL